MRRTFPLALLLLFAMTVDARPPAHSGRFRLLTSTPTGSRFRSQAVKLNDGQVLVVGAWNSMNIDRFDPSTEVFTNVASDAIARVRHTATLLADGRVLIAGGADFGNAGTVVADCRIFDPSTNSVSAAASMATARQDHTATLLADGRVLVAGGSNSTSLNLAAAEVYDPSANSWSAAGNLQAGRYGHTATLLGNNKVLIAGGWGGERHKVELYDPAANTFAFGPPLQKQQRLRATATRLTDGKVVIIGGFRNGGDGGPGEPWVEVYDPATNTIAYGGQLAYACGGHSAALLADGRILVTGDDIYSGTPEATQQGSIEAQVYDPAAKRGTAIRKLRKPRMLSPSVTLNDGRVVVIGGTNPAAWDNAEIWEPNLQGGARGDVDLNLRGDIWWYRAASNQTILWSMNGFSGSSQDLSVSSDTVVPTTGDFDGGGSGDLYVHQLTQWFIRGFIERHQDGALTHVRYSIFSTAYDMPFPVAQMVFRPRDMDGDGRDDPFTLNPGNGQYFVWMSSDLGFRDLGALPLIAEPGWFIAGIDDFDGDGNGDVLWRHNIRGENYIWFIDGARVAPPNPPAPYELAIPRAGQTTAVPDQNYQVKGTGDFDGDGKADLVWRNDATGDTVVWLMDGVTANGAPVPAPGAGWQFVTAVDFDGDEKQDILWRNPTTGENGICLMNGFSATCGGIPSVTAAGWTIIAP